MCSLQQCLLALGAQSSEGAEFAFALSPSSTGGRIYDGELILNARHTTQVTITTSSSTDTLAVYGNSSVHYVIPTSMRAVDGIEDKGWSIGKQKPRKLNLDQCAF